MYYAFPFLLPTFLAPDLSCSRRPSRTMTSMSVARCINEILPEEVLGVIFEEHAKLEWRAPIIHGQVCRQWKQTLLRSPRAWAHLRIVPNFTSAPSKLQQWLDRSGSAPLHIQVIDWIQGVEGVLDRHCKRIESISLHYYRLACFKDRSFSILQSLTIIAWTNAICWSPWNEWSEWRAMPALLYLRANNIRVNALPSNIFPRLRDLVLFRVKNCDSIIRNASHSLNSLMLSRISLKYTSESLEFPSLRFLSLYDVKNIKHRMNVPALTTYHESNEKEEEAFSMSLPFLIEYGIYGLCNELPLDATKLHQCYPNISRISIRACASDVKLFLHSLSDQPTALPMLRILALSDSKKYSTEDKDSMRSDVSMRNIASSVKMELYFDGVVRVPLYFADVRVYIPKFEVN